MIKELLLSIALSGTIGLGASNTSNLPNNDSFFGSILSSYNISPIGDGLCADKYYYTIIDNIPVITSHIYLDYNNEENLKFYVFDSTGFGTLLGDMPMDGRDFCNAWFVDPTFAYADDGAYYYTRSSYEYPFVYLLEHYIDGAMDYIQQSSFCITVLTMELYSHYTIDFNYATLGTDSRVIFLDLFADFYTTDFFNAIGSNGYYVENDSIFLDDVLFYTYDNFYYNNTDLHSNYIPYVYPSKYVGTTQDYYQPFTYCDNFFPNDDGEWSDGYFPLYVDNDPNVGTSAGALYGYTNRYHFEFNYSYYSRCSYFFTIILPTETATFSEYHNIGTYYFSDTHTAYNNGYYDGKNDGQREGYNQGYQYGYDIGVGQSNLFWSLFGGIADTPVLMIRSLFNFELFGVNLLGAVLSMLTGVIVLFIVRKFI